MTSEREKILKKRSISIIIPALNEEGNIQGSIDAAVYAAEKNFEDYEIIVVNDGSTDGTLTIIEENLRNNNKIRVITHPETRGFGASYNSGRNDARMQYSVMVHGDNVFPRETLDEVFSAVGKADVVCGYIKNPESRNRIRQLISKAFTKFMNVFFRLSLKYYNGIQIHKTEWLKKIKLNSTGFGFQSELLIKAIKEGKTYIEVPYIHVERPGGGATKIFKPKNIWSVLKTIIHLAFWKPNKKNKQNQEA